MKAAHASKSRPPLKSSPYRTRDAHEMTILTTKTTKLPDAIRTLCNRVAVERTRAACWAEGQRLRQFCRDRMSEGASVVELTGFLARELEQAMLSQQTGPK